MFKAPLVPGRVSVVIPHWNGKRFLETCLTALRNQQYHDVEVIVADNASTDGSQAYIREHFPEVIIEQLPQNRGFTGACNAGMQVASGEFIALLNNDTEVAPDWLQEVVSGFMRYPEAGAVASKMLLFHQRDHIHTAGDFYRVDGRPVNRGVWQQDTGQYDREEYVFSACGGSSIYRRQMLEDVGLLDDRFFYSVEDVDLGWRSQLMGYQCVYIPTAVVYHELAASGAGVTAGFYSMRNIIYTMMKNYPGPLLRQHWRDILRYQWAETKVLLRHLYNRTDRAKLRGKLVGMLTMWKFLKTRRQLQAQRRVTVDYLGQILSPVPASEEDDVSLPMSLPSTAPTRRPA
jgi:GT2 family glycosyltransferase